jgi:hypothetical protein
MGWAANEALARLPWPQGAGTAAHLLARYAPDRLVHGWELDPVVVMMADMHMGMGQLTAAGRLVSAACLCWQQPGRQVPFLHYVEVAAVHAVAQLSAATAVFACLQALQGPPLVSRCHMDSPHRVLSCSIPMPWWLFATSPH